MKKEEVQKTYNESEDIHVRKELAQILCVLEMGGEWNTELRERYQAILNNKVHKKRLDSTKK